MYEDDTPPAERRAQALSLDRDLLRELLGQEELRDLLDARRRRGGRAAAARRPARRPTSCTTSCACAATGARASTTRRSRRRCSTSGARCSCAIAGEERLIAAEDAGRYRDALGAMPPSGLPDAFLEGGPDSLRQLVLRFAKGRGPFTTAEANERFGRDVAALLAELEREELLVRGELRPGGTEREWCDPDVLRRLRRASLAALRREVEPVEREALARFLPSWHGIDRRASLREALVPLQALPLPVALWESRAASAPRSRLPARAPRRALRERRGRLGRRRRSTASRSTSARTPRRSAASPARRRPEGEEHDALRAALGRGAASGTTCSTRPGSTTTRRCRRSGTSSGRAR